jgi:hypothetical protein
MASGARPGSLSRVSSWKGESLVEQASLPLNAHKRIVDWSRMVEPVARRAICRLATRRSAVGIERELVMSQRRLVTMRALWTDRRVRAGLDGRWIRRRTPRHQSNDCQEDRQAFHRVPAFDENFQHLIGG